MSDTPYTDKFNDYKTAFRTAREKSGLEVRQFEGYTLEENISIAKHLDTKMIEFVVNHNSMPWNADWLEACKIELLERVVLGT